MTICDNCGRRRGQRVVVPPRAVPRLHSNLDAFSHQLRHAQRLEERAQQNRRLKTTVADLTLGDYEGNKVEKFENRVPEYDPDAGIFKTEAKNWDDFVEEASERNDLFEKENGRTPQGEARETGHTAAAHAGSSGD